MSDTTMSAPSKEKAKSSRPGTLALLLNNSLATSGLVVLVLICLIALAAPLLPLTNPDVTAPADRLLPVFTEGHLLGTDHLGRDILSRLIWGTRISLAVGLSATIIAAFFGSLPQGIMDTSSSFFTFKLISKARQRIHHRVEWSV